MQQYITGVSIAECIKQYGSDSETCFVFPSRIAARLWLYESLSITGLSAVAADSYLAWDTFKIECCCKNQNQHMPVSQVIRLLFAHYIATKNANTMPPLFTNLIPAAYAAQSSIFARWIAGILPQLDHWEKRSLKLNTQVDIYDSLSCNTEKNILFDFAKPPVQTVSTGEHADSLYAEAIDLPVLKAEYTAFLEKNNLFEPSWISALFTPNARRYIICYPELIEDFSEYEQLLHGRQDVLLLKIPPFDTQHIPLIEYTTIGGEIRNTVLAVEKLLAEGVLPNTIAISVADIEQVTPYLKREFSLRNIPAEFRLGFKLGNQQAGMLFSLIGECVQNHYSFESMKSLLLNPHIPWKEKNCIQAFINFGIRNNCLVSWRENTKTASYKNVWIEAFRLSIPANSRNYETELLERNNAEQWFTGFMYHAEKLVQAKSFSQIQKQYFLLKAKYINETDFSAEDNAVLGRCITVLQELIKLESSFETYVPKSPYRFFVEQLLNEIYVPQNTGTAVSIFPFRVAAATPFKHHFILNCSQKASRVLYQKLPFLRKDRRELLGITEKDATSHFFSGYAIYGDTVFSYSNQTFNGFVIPNGIFEHITPLNHCDQAMHDSEDSLLQELRFFSHEISALPKKLYPIQRKGFNAFYARQQAYNFSLLYNPFHGSNAALSRTLHTRYYENNLFKISATSLKTYYECPVKWLLKSVLLVKEEETNAELFNPKYIGTITHIILEHLYHKIRKQDGRFISGNKELYEQWACNFFDQFIYMQTAFRGPLAAPFIESLKKRVLKSASFVLAFDCNKLDGYIPLCMEEKIEYSMENMLLYGYIDRIAYDAAESRAVILDYKTGNTPSASVYNPDTMNDFQMPMYIALAEHQRIKATVEHAFFLDISKQSVTYIVNDKTAIAQDRCRSAKTREAFEPSMQAFFRAAQAFCNAAKHENFCKHRETDCTACTFKNVCRTMYIVDKD